MDVRRGTGDRGAGTVVALCVVVTCVLGLIVVARVVTAAAAQAAAQHAADAAALAGVSGGASKAGEMARANGADLVDYAVEPGHAGGAVRVTVTVRHGGRTATATAEGDPRPRRLTSGGGGVAPHCAPRCSTLDRCPMATSDRRPPPPRTRPRTTTRW